MSVVDSRFTKRLSFGKWRRPLFWGLAVLLTIWIGFLAWKWPFTRKAVVAALGQESARAVRIGSFHSTLFPPGYSAENVLLLKPAETKGGEGSVQIRKLIVVATWSDILLLRKRIEQATISGLRIRITALPAGAQSQSEGATQNKQLRFAEIGQFKLEDAVFAFPLTQQDSDPFSLALESIAFDHVNGRSASPFHARVLVNEPDSVIRSEGQLGPWDWKDPGRTPLSGSFAVERGDLSSFGGIAGVFTGSGKFKGPLRQVACSGMLDIPQFRVGGNPHSTDLSATFRVTINGLNGDTTLDRLQSRLNHTLIEAAGQVEADRARPGKAASLHLSVDGGRVEDLLSLFTHNAHPAMTGQISMQVNVHIPPGPPGFLQKVDLSGDFDINGGRFANAQTQTEINHLSKSSEGMTKSEEKTDPAIVLSDLRGQIVAHHGTATLSHAAITAPGTNAALSGTCSLINTRLNLHGLLKTTGKLGDTTSGLKTALLKVVTPFWKKNSMTVVPFTISGTTRNPAFALAVVKKRRS